MRNFKTDNVIVRRFEMNDVEQAYYNLSLYEDISDMANYKTHKSMDETRMIIKSAINEFYTDEPIWAVEDKKSKNLVGFIRVTNYSAKNKRCNITWTMAYKYWNTCFMKDALIKTINFLFLKKDIELIVCSYYGDNKISGEILESVGMRKEAVLRERKINEKTNEKENCVIYSINKQEFYDIYYSRESYYKIQNVKAH